MRRKRKKTRSSETCVEAICKNRAAVPSARLRGLGNSPTSKTEKTSFLPKGRNSFFRILGSKCIACEFLIHPIYAKNKLTKGLAYAIKLVEYYLSAVLDDGSFTENRQSCANHERYRRCKCGGCTHGESRSLSDSSGRLSADR